jgi:hypothetical protein
MSAAGGSSKAAPVLALFRQIMRLHRDKLPPPMRAMGDTYVKDEFRKHLKGKTTDEQWRVFMHEWQRYHAMLAGNADILTDPAAAAAAQAGDVSGAAATTTVSAAASGSCGELAEDVINLMTPDQRARLARLQQEAGRFGKGLLTPTEASGKGGAAAGGGEGAATGSQGQPT